MEEVAGAYHPILPQTRRLLLAYGVGILVVRFADAEESGARLLCRAPFCRWFIALAAFPSSLEQEPGKRDCQNDDSKKCRCCERVEDEAWRAARRRATRHKCGDACACKEVEDEAKEDVERTARLLWTDAA